MKEFLKSLAAQGMISPVYYRSIMLYAVKYALQYLFKAIAAAPDHPLR